MDASSPLRSWRYWALWGCLCLATGLVVWFGGFLAGLWRLPLQAPVRESAEMPPLPDEPLLASQPARPGVTLYLPAILVAPPPRVRAPVARAKSTLPRENPGAGALSLPDLLPEGPPFLDRPGEPEDREAPPDAGVPTGGSVGGAVDAVETPALPVPTVEPDEAGRWIWPVRGELSQGFSSVHRAIDIVTEHGALVFAPDGGKVVYADWHISGYGYLVIVDHGDGYVSYYAHLYGFYVDVGQQVERGDLIGQLGTTGHSTGPHLHFEIRYRGISRDPLDLLPPEQELGRAAPSIGLL